MNGGRYPMLLSFLREFYLVHAPGLPGAHKRQQRSRSGDSCSLRLRYLLNPNPTAPTPATEPGEHQFTEKEVGSKVFV